ncbi:MULTISPECIES: GNAT family N-acetyltransferase [Phenylobacterium]|uniref:GNAT superfamily N-acetyltransferase n=1 Tax=Phenylobacterium koreense TaxID=266125 RepID=A0ABV2EDQ2_9CAUL
MTTNQPAGMPPAEAARLAAIELETRFTLDSDGRIIGEAPPDLSPGPLLYVADLEPRLMALSHAVPQEVAAGADADSLEASLLALSAMGPVNAAEGLSFLLPHRTAAPTAAELVAWGTAPGSALETRFAEAGMPEALVRAGFREVADLWPPWCAAMVDGEVAALAFSARLSPIGAELGLVTLPAYRGRGLAAAATAGWSALPALADRTLFYSTTRSNFASQRVAAKLGLPFICATWEIVRA